MTDSFDKRLLRLLLIFALLPTFLLTLVGYFLTTETTMFSIGGDSTGLERIITYHHELIFVGLERELSSFIEHEESQPVIADIVFVTKDDSITMLIGDSLVASSVITSLNRHDHTHNRGFVEIDSLICQYASRSLPDGRAMYATVIHDTSYMALLTNFEDERVALSTQRELYRRYLGFLGILFATLAITVTALAYYFSSRMARSLSRPLANLANAAQGIAAGDFRQVVDPADNREMQTLIDSFNNMATRLDDTTARLAQSERVAAWRHIARRFAHELKNPLQPILVSLYRIEKVIGEESATKSIKDSLHAASEEVKHLTNLAERFSTLAKLPPPSPEITSLNRLLSSVTELYREELSDYAFHLQLPLEEVYASLDETYFREAVHNLLKNARDATDSGEQIVVRLSTLENVAMIAVEDSGVGMSKEVLAKARMPYFTTKTTGSGLGLAIVEKTINEIGGRLMINSTPGSGTKVVIHLPQVNRTDHG